MTFKLSTESRIREAYKKFKETHSKHRERVMLMTDLLDILNLTIEEQKRIEAYREGEKPEPYLVADIGYKSGYSIGYEDGLKAAKELKGD